MSSNNQMAVQQHWQRLHWIALITLLIRGVKQLYALIGVIILQAINTFDKQTTTSKLVLLILGIITVAFWIFQALSTWITTQYSVDANGISYRSGFFNKKHVFIPFEQIHVIASSQSWYCKPFSVLTASISVAGDDKTSIQLLAISEQTYQQLEQSYHEHSAKHKQSHTDTATENSELLSSQHSLSNSLEYNKLSTIGKSNTNTEEVTVIDTNTPVRENKNAITGGTVVGNSTATIISTGNNATLPTYPSNVPSYKNNAYSSQIAGYHAKISDIIIFALTDVRWLASVMVLYGFYSQYNDKVPRSIHNWANTQVDAAMHAGWIIISLLVFAVLLIVAIASVILTLFRFANFSVTRNGNNIVISRGILSVRTVSVLVEHIQSVSIRTTLLRRCLGLCSVQLGTSATQGVGDDQVGNGLEVIPVIARSRVFNTLQLILPEIEINDVPVRYTARGLYRYYATVPVVSTIVVSVGSAVAIWYWDLSAWLMILPIFAGIWWLAVRLLSAYSEGYALYGKDRICVHGTSVFTLYELYTSRMRVETLTQSAPPWWGSSAISRVEMQIFVKHDISSVTLRAMHNSDVYALSQWLRESVYF